MERRKKPAVPHGSRVEMIIPQIQGSALNFPQFAVLSRQHRSGIKSTMRHATRSYLIILLFLNGRLFSAEIPVTATATTTWPMNETNIVGGHPATVYGHPQVARDATRDVIHFNGTSDGLLVPVNPLAGWSEFTIEALICPETGGTAEQRFFHLEDAEQNRAMMEIRLTKEGWALDTFLFTKKSRSRRTLLDRTKLHPSDRWTWVALVYAKGHMTSYVDGVRELTGDVDFSPMTSGQLSLGVRQNKMYWYKGSLGGIRFHPTALPADKLQRAELK